MLRCRSCFKPFTALAIGPSGGAEEAARGASPAEVEPPAVEVDADLRTVVARLGEIQRKAGALGQERPELAELAPALDVALRDLRVGHGPRGEPLPLRELAMPLGSWARRLERLGVPALGRELAYVERALVAADDARADKRLRGEKGVAAEEAPVREAAPAAPVAPVVGAERRPGSRGALLILAVATVVVAAGVALLATLARSRQEERKAQPETGAPAAATPPSPNQAPAAVNPTPPLANPPPRPALSSAEVADLASSAQLAAQRDEVDLALERLDAAARADRTRFDVRAAAQATVDALVARSDRAVAGGATSWPRRSSSGPGSWSAASCSTRAGSRPASTNSRPASG